MGLIAKTKNHNNTESWGMGFFLVFFPEDEEDNTTTTININKNKPLNSSSSSAKFNTLLRRTNSSHILTTAQSTISICALLIFITLLLFTLSTFDPNSTSPPFNSRRHLSSTQKPINNSPPHALQGMGTLYFRGTKAMNDLIICHLIDSVTHQDLRFFLRALLSSGLTSRSDVVFLLPNSPPSSFNSLIHQETHSFFKIIHQRIYTTNSNSNFNFDLTQFLKSPKKDKEWADPIWGRRIQAQPNVTADSTTQSTRLSLGSIMSFEVDELDPENSFSGFLDHIPMSLRRWACYPMLLGRIRRNFKHIMLVDVKDTIIFSDPLSQVTNRSPESVYLTQFASSKHGKKNSDKSQSVHKAVNPGVIMGGVRGVRRLANAVVTEVARAAMQHSKKKSSVTESVILSQLAGNSNLLKNVNFVISTESITELSSVNLGLGSGGLSVANLTVVRRGNSNNLDVVHSAIMNHLCSFLVDSSVYSDC